MSLPCRVASGHPLVTETAKQILKSGGNAFDAVVAAGLTSCVVEPLLASLGGGGFLLTQENDGECRAFDFFTDFPGREAQHPLRTEDFVNVPVNFPNTTQNFHSGAATIAVPGVLKGLVSVQRQLGFLPLSALADQAAHLAINGHEVNSTSAYVATLLKSILELSPEGKRIYFPNGRLIQEGDILRNPELGEFLYSLESGAMEEFYEGETAKKICKYLLLEKGCPLGLEDLKRYEVMERKPLQFEMGNFEVLTNPYPAFGGGALANLLEEYNQINPGSHMIWGELLHVQMLARAMSRSHSFREGLDRAMAFERSHPDAPPSTTARGTTHVTVGDSKGNVACLSMSNGEGSGLFAKDTGIMLNNMLGEEDLHQKGLNQVRPGKRISSMMAPTFIRKKGFPEVVLALGSGGSNRIRTAIAQTIINFSQFKCSLKDAIGRPRMHWDGTTLQMESGFEPSAIQGLPTSVPVNTWEASDLYFGGVHAITRESACGDPRRCGSAWVE